MNYKTKVLLVTALASTLTLQACKSPNSRPSMNVESLLESDGSGDWQRVKTDSRIKDYAVFLSPDGRYYAFNVQAFQDGMTRDQFLASAAVYSNLQQSTEVYYTYEQSSYRTYYSYYCPYEGADTSIRCAPSSFDAYGNITSFYVEQTDYRWVANTETIYSDWYTGLVFERGDTTSKDLESVSAAVEAAGDETVRDMLVAGYGLSEDRASEIASLSRSWKNIEKTRAMTAKDLAEFQSKVFGSDLNSLRKAAVKASEGDGQDYNKLIERAARLNDISPEQAKAIFKEFAN